MSETTDIRLAKHLSLSILENASPEFWSRLSDIHCSAFLDIGENGWSPESLRATSLSQGVHVILVEPAGPIDPGLLNAFALIRTIETETELITLAVSPANSGYGLGTRLLQNCLSAAEAVGGKHMFLEVRASNGRAVRMYENAGFGKIGLRQNYYHLNDDSRHDAITMRFDLG